MRARTAVYERVRAAGVITRHTADAAAVGGGSLGREEEAVGFAGEVQLVAHDAGFDDGIALLGIDLQDTVHVATDVGYDTVTYDLTGYGSAARTRNERGLEFVSLM